MTSCYSSGCNRLHHHCHSDLCNGAHLCVLILHHTSLFQWAMCWHVMFSKIPPSHEGILNPPPFNTWFRGPMRVCFPAIFAGLMVGNDTHTDRPCYSAIGHIYAMHAMWLNNVYSVLVLWVWLQEKHPTCIVEM